MIAYFPEVPPKMFDLPVAASQQPALLAGLKKLPSVKMTSATKGQFTHRSGLEVDFEVVKASNSVHVVIVKNPEGKSDSEIKERFIDDVESILHLAK